MSQHRVSRSTRANPMDPEALVPGSRQSNRARSDAKHAGKTKAAKSSPKSLPTIRSRRAAVAVDTSDDDDEDEQAEDDESTSPDGNAPPRGRTTTIIQSPWAGPKRGDATFDDDNASISDLDMHGSVSSDSGVEDVLEADADDSASDGSAGDDVEIADDDDDYGDLDNLSDSSENSEQFEAEAEAAWQHDGIDWTDNHVYQYDDRPNRGFIFEEQFLGADLAHVWDDWQVQFLDFADRGQHPPPRVHNDVPMHHSPLVRRVDEMSMSDANPSASGSDTSESSAFSAASANTARRNDQITHDEGDEYDDDDEAGDTTDDDLPDESNLPSPIRSQPRRVRHSRRSSSSSSTSSSLTPARRTPVMSRMPVDHSRAIVCSVRNAEGKFVRRIIQPTFNRTNLVYVSDNRRLRNPDGSPVSSTSSVTERGYVESNPLVHIITGRLFQEAHFGPGTLPVSASPVPLAARNSFLSGPALHDSGISDVTSDFDEVPPHTHMPDLAQLINFNPDSGRIRARSADIPSAVDLGSSAVHTDGSDALMAPSTPLLSASAMEDSPAPTTRSGATTKAPLSSPRKRRSSDASDSPLASPNTKRKRAGRVV